MNKRYFPPKITTRSFAKFSCHVRPKTELVVNYVEIKMWTPYMSITNTAQNLW